jgi:hypothetical protein
MRSDEKKKSDSNKPVFIQLRQKPDAKSQLWNKEEECLEH